ncbi:MAG: hypothetical protein HKM06_09915 [Spirochaetales bacterium]|nr:hypothetical protein [Spirochaetales bacterium]
MKKSTIGILQADGSFFPVVEESQIGKKRLILTAARSDQDSVKIDIRRSEDGTSPTGAHLGTLALQKSSEGDIELEIELDADGHLSASASWPQGGPRQSIAVDLNDYREPLLSEAEPDPFSQIPDLETHGDDRSDRDILSDASLDAFELDEIPAGPESLDLEELPSEESPADSGSQDSLTLDLPDLDSFDLPATPAPSEDLPALDDLDSGFGLDSFSDEPQPTAQPSPSAESSEDDLYDFPDLSLDADVPSIELSDSSLSSFDLESPDTESLSPTPDFASSKLNQGDFDDSFHQSSWEPPAQDPEPQKTSRTERPTPSPKPSEDSGPPLAERGFAPVDRVALVLSLTTLGLLILVLLGLLFLNFLRPVSLPVIKPEVFLPSSSSPALAMARAEPANPLEVPQDLRGGAFHYNLKPGDQPLDLTRKLGPVNAERRSDAWIW